MPPNQLFYGDNLGVLRQHIADEAADLQSSNGSLTGWRDARIQRC